jgi:hypothetical protein
MQMGRQRVKAQRLFETVPIEQDETETAICGHIVKDTAQCVFEPVAIEKDEPETASSDHIAKDTALCVFEPVPIEEKDDTEWGLESIITRRWNKLATNPHWVYLIKWVGHTELTEEPVLHLTGCMGLVERYINGQHAVWNNGTEEGAQERRTILQHYWGLCDSPGRCICPACTASMLAECPTFKMLSERRRRAAAQRLA